MTQGLFVLRYVSSKAGLNAPTVLVSTPPGSPVDVISPGEGGPQLVSPGDGVVVRAARDAFLNLTVRPSHINGSCDAELVLERVSTTIRQAEPLPEPEDFTRGGSVPLSDDIEILAHVSRRGDVVTKSGQWICGPQLPMAIEGVEIRWKNRPQGVDILAQATINARGLRQLPEQPIGSFVGTRGKAAPLTALNLAVVGPAADDFSLACDALFLGASVMNVSGKSCALSGATGWEPLVGLRISVVSAVDQAARQTVGFLRSRAAEEEVAPPLAARRPVEAPSRVRVFRSSRARPAPALLLSK
ncbi:hypothetical protein [Terrarubrum flagellatum]|uniref:hypothetical protein n=1 Tax=Terrirubrum flagellatum TaxID=2895980 RepID=UPI0031453C8D